MSEVCYLFTDFRIDPTSALQPTLVSLGHSVFFVIEYQFGKLKNHISKKLVESKFANSLMKSLQLRIPAPPHLQLKRQNCVTIFTNGQT